jgi:hypothetical protein
VLSWCLSFGDCEGKFSGPYQLRSADVTVETAMEIGLQDRELVNAAPPSMEGPHPGIDNGGDFDAEGHQNAMEFDIHDAGFCHSISKAIGPSEWQEREWLESLRVEGL